MVAITVNSGFVELSRADRYLRQTPAGAGKIYRDGARAASSGPTSSAWASPTVSSTTPASPTPSSTGRPSSARLDWCPSSWAAGARPCRGGASVDDGRAGEPAGGHPRRSVAPCAAAGVPADPRGALADRADEQVTEHLVRLRDARQRDPLHRGVDRGGRGVPAKNLRGDRDVAGEAAGPLRSVRNLRQRLPALLFEPASRPSVQAREHALTRQHADRHDALPLGPHHRQRHPGA